MRKILILVVLGLSITTVSFAGLLNSNVARVLGVVTNVDKQKMQVTIQDDYTQKKVTLTVNDSQFSLVSVGDRVAATHNHDSTVARYFKKIQR